MKILSMPGAAAPLFPFYPLDQSWDYLPNVARTIPSSGETLWNMLVETPEINNNTLRVELTRPGFCEIRVDYSIDHGSTWAQLINATAGTQIYTQSLSAYNGHTLRLRVRANTYGTGGSVTPVGATFEIV